MKKSKIVSNFFIILIPILVMLFLSGKIINIPNGTTSGGIIAAVGVTLIFFVSIVLHFVLKFLLCIKKKKS